MKFVMKLIFKVGLIKSLLSYWRSVPHLPQVVFRVHFVQLPLLAGSGALKNLVPGSVQPKQGTTKKGRTGQDRSGSRPHPDVWQ